jgi:hypothetical protein
VCVCVCLSDVVSGCPCSRDRPVLYLPCAFVSVCVFVCLCLSLSISVREAGLSSDAYLPGCPCFCAACPLVFFLFFWGGVNLGYVNFQGQSLDPEVQPEVCVFASTHAHTQALSGEQVYVCACAYISCVCVYTC